VPALSRIAARFHPLLIAPTAQNRAVTFRRTLLSGLSAAAINGERMSSLGALPPTEETRTEIPCRLAGRMSAWLESATPASHGLFIAVDPHARRAHGPRRPRRGLPRWPASTSAEESKILPRSLAVQCRGIASVRRTGVRVYLHYVHPPVQDLSEKAQLGISRLLDLGDPIARVLDDRQRLPLLLLMIHHPITRDWCCRNAHQRVKTLLKVIGWRLTGYRAELSAGLSRSCYQSRILAMITNEGRNRFLAQSRSLVFASCRSPTQTRINPLNRDVFGLHFLLTSASTSVNYPENGGAISEIIRESRKLAPLEWNAEADDEIARN